MSGKLVIGRNATRKRNHWTLRAKVALMLGVGVGLAACSAPPMPSSPIMNKARVESTNAGPTPLDGWQEKAEQSFALMGMKVDRFEWSEAVKGSYSRFHSPNPRELEKPEPGERLGTLDISLKVVQVGRAGWYGCGWAHLSERFDGINGRVVQVAIPLRENPAPNAAHLAVRASEICRYSSMMNPTQEDGTGMARPGYVRPQGSAEEDIRIQFGGKWATSTRVGRDLVFFKVPEDASAEEATRLFQMSLGNDAVGKPEDRYVTYRKSSSVVRQRF